MRRQTEIFYQSEPAYLKSVLLWLQEYWTGPAPRFYPFGKVESLRHSAQRVHAASNRQDAIIDLRTFLPCRSGSRLWGKRRPRKRTAFPLSASQVKAPRGDDQAGGDAK